MDDMLVRTLENRALSGCNEAVRALANMARRCPAGREVAFMACALAEEAMIAAYGSLQQADDQLKRVDVADTLVLSVARHSYYSAQRELVGHYRVWLGARILTGDVLTNDITWDMRVLAEPDLDPVMLAMAWVEEAEEAAMDFIKQAAEARAAGLR